MENNNPERALGTCTDELSPEVQEQIATIAENAARGFDKLRDALSEALQPVIESAKEIFKNVSEMLMSYYWQDYEWQMAQLWAYGARPEWMRIYNRTKKRRTRKKYHDKILREYRKEKADNGR